MRPHSLISANKLPDVGDADWQIGRATQIQIQILSGRLKMWRVHCTSVLNYISLCNIPNALVSSFRSGLLGCSSDISIRFIRRLWSSLGSRRAQKDKQQFKRAQES